MHLRITLILLSSFISISLFSSNILVDNVRVVNRDGIADNPFSVIFDISWENAWHNDKNHDAAWVFIKFGTQYDNHARLSQTGHRILQNRETSCPAPQIDVDRNGVGFMLYPSDTYRGSINLKLQVVLDTVDQELSYSRLNGLSVHALEMVYIPQGSFTIGSPDIAAIKRASVYKSNAKGEPNGLIAINSEASIKIAPEEGTMYYWSEEPLYNGDQNGPIPDDFPKGYDPFYIMKYELNQGQYAAFLNTLPGGWTYTRSPIGGKTYYKNRGGIRLEDGKYVADSPQRPMNYVSFTDGLAFTDWAGLRPITELEYEKAARGPGDPIDAEFVWGTNSYDNIERYVNQKSELVLSNGYDESLLTDENRDVFGASYYWVMDLSGSVWEKVITFGNPIGRSFKGSHGDGNLDFGHATNEDWPKSDDEVGGFGYRGGGYYQVGTVYSDFNPHSPIGYRYYGAWSGGPRSIAYGYRAGRSAMK